MAERGDELGPHGASPIADAELDGLLAGAADATPRRRWILAVSGGADSMALMHLVHQWAARAADRGGGRLIADTVVATVDHGLRPESAAEARWVGERAVSLGFHHETLVWHGAKPAAGIQAAARQARYQLLAELLHRLGGDREVLTGHHLDDQVETFLMRLARGSGIDGLSAMRDWVLLPVNGERGRPLAVTVRRPLLWTPKARLIATLRAAGLPWLEDPSNQRPDFERVRLRRLLPALAAAGITTAQIGRSIRRLQRAAAAGVSRRGHDDPTRGGAVDWHRGAYVTIDWRRLEPDADGRIRLLMAVLAAFGTDADGPRLLQVEAAFAQLARGQTPALTLNGCILSQARPPAPLTIFREPGRQGLAEAVLGPGDRGSWDRRFDAHLDAAATASVAVRALGARAATSLGARLGQPGLRLPRRAAVTLPSVWQGEVMIAVPHLAGLDPALAGPLAGSRRLLRITFCGEDVAAAIAK